MTVHYYHDGRTDSVSASQIDVQKIREILDDLIGGTTETLRLLVSEERVNRMRSEQSGVEIVFSEETTFESPLRGAVRLTRVFVPFTGPLAGSEERPGTAVVVGDDSGYRSGPLLNPGGYTAAAALKDEVEAAVEGG